MDKKKKILWKTVILSNALHISRKNNFNFAINEHMVPQFLDGSTMILFAFSARITMIFFVSSYLSIFRFPIKYLGDGFCILDKCCPHCPVQYQRSREKSSCRAGCRPGGHFTKNKDKEGVGKYWLIGSWEIYLSLKKKKIVLKYLGCKYWK